MEPAALPSWPYTSGMPALSLPPAPDEAATRLVRGESVSPHDLLGAHSATIDGVSGVVIRAWQPRARRIDVVIGEQHLPMQREVSGLYSVFVPDRKLPLRYRFEMTDDEGQVRTFDDPYRFLPTIGDVDLHLFNEGRHLRLWEKMGAHVRTIDGVDGTAFTVWAPNATRVSVSGDFNRWDGRAHTMRRLGASGVFELFIPGIGAETLYKFEIRTRTGALRVKTDPFAAKLEQGPGHASIVQARSRYPWRDGRWLAERADSDLRREPMLVYEVHLGSWLRGDDNRLLSYREIAPRLASHVSTLGFTHVELLPVQDHPFGGSWGYQVGGYFAPNSRHGSPDDLRFLVDTLHEAGIGVLLDWVPAHFPKDDWALRRFDGTACYEHEDPRLGDHPEWGTHIFNYARHEVRNFLVANALYWIEEFHLDGLRVDAVASMLYLDYGREAGQWLRNRFGGRENLEAVAFLKQLNLAMQSLHPGVVTIAEESTSWPKVTAPIRDGGLGFTFKWNMGWMHDTLDYFRVDPFFRKGAHEKLTFAIWYEYSERFMNPLSHDEVVHLKRSLLEKMPGDMWQKFANLRTLLGYSITRPGKSLFFMGTELAPHREWNHDVSLEWELLEDPRRRGLSDFLQALQQAYRAHACFWRSDHEPAGFRWIDVADREQSVLSYARFDGDAHALVVLNLTPVPRDQYRLGVPRAGRYRLLLNSDASAFGGSGYPVFEEVTTDAMPYHGFDASIVLSLPPLAMLVLLPEGDGATQLTAPSSEGATSKPVKVKTAKPKTEKAKTTKSDVATLEVKKPKTTKRKATTPKVARPTITKSAPEKPKVATPKVVKTESPKSATPKVETPKTQPAVNTPKTVKPKVAKPRTARAPKKDPSE
ncbi:1,4-alpha-glucan branching enzyme [Gemmatimonas aurantiaca T-27]|uniref:1,4-alpha-glucan branching enzyme GlgB n=2 Tax=Gemmatimonas aurantiaca TaxID=173480 RepID=C1AAF4_GEMAT|nr:1,4-alpha-glucan branching enzyme [Gemmatimonas aurantiaca T-27]